MGLRFYRRKKIIGGLGINLSKSGASWSVRTKSGSIGPKGHTIRTGVSGLTYVYRNKKNAHNSTRNNPSNSNSFIVALILTLVTYFINFYAAIFTAVIIGIVYIVNKISNTKIVDKGIANESSIDNETIEDPITDEAVSESKPALGTSQLLTAENIFIEFDEIIKDVEVEQIISNPLYFLKIPNNDKHNIKIILLYDLCKILKLLNIQIEEEGIEGDLLLVAINHFIQRDTQQETISIIQELNYPIAQFVLKEEENPFLGIFLLRKYNSQNLGAYKKALRDFIALITTLDLSLEKKEKDLLLKFSSY